jgi:putative transposase
LSAAHDRIAIVFSSLLYMVLRRLLSILSSRDCAARQVELENLVLRHQVAILRRQVKRPAYRMSDCALLAAASLFLPRERWNALLVRPETVLRWHRWLVARKWTRTQRRPGRPGLDPAVQALIIRLAKENPRWDYMRIKGECQNLGVRVSATAIATLLRRHNIGPAPRRGPTWSEFLRAQASGILACDFFTVETALLKTLYVLLFIEIGTRALHVTAATSNPDSAFVTQQARNLAMSLAEEGAQVEFLIRDRDAKFSRSFDDVFVGEGNTVTGFYNSVSGGSDGQVAGQSSSISGGRFGTVNGFCSSISCGGTNLPSWGLALSGNYLWAAGRSGTAGVPAYSAP